MPCPGHGRTPFAGRTNSGSGNSWRLTTRSRSDASRAPQPLESWLNTLKTRLTVTEFEYDGLNARVFGDVGVVYARFVWKGALDGTPFTDSGFLADVWRKRDGRWQVVARRSAARQQIRKIPGLH